MLTAKRDKQRLIWIMNRFLSSSSPFVDNVIYEKHLKWIRKCIRTQSTVGLFSKRLHKTWNQSPSFHKVDEPSFDGKNDVTFLLRIFPYIRRMKSCNFAVKLNN